MNEYFHDRHGFWILKLLQINGPPFCLFVKGKQALNFFAHLKTSISFVPKLVCAHLGHCVDHFSPTYLEQREGILYKNRQHLYSISDVECHRYRSGTELQYMVSLASGLVQFNSNTPSQHVFARSLHPV